jgi:uncharacterized protein involved in exopolysaccharide biosynthesis
MDHLSAPDHDDEIDLLDLLVTVTENLKLLLLGPLLAGLLALGASFQLPSKYESTAIINPQIRSTNPQIKSTNPNPNLNLVVAWSQAAVVLDPVREATQFKPELDPDLARLALRKSIKASISKQDGLVTLTVTAETPELAQQIQKSLKDQIFKQFVPKGAVLARLQDRLRAEEEALAAGRQLQSDLALKIKDGVATDAVINAYAGLVSSNSTKLQLIQSIEAQLQGLDADAVVQPANLPLRPVSNKKALIAVVTALATGFALLLFVFIRQAVRNAGANPESAAKLARIRQALGWRASKA